MIKKHWKLLVLTSILILLPVAAGLVLWNRLPAEMPTHWNVSGEVDDWGSKAFVVFGLPGIMLAAQWLCVLGTAADPKKRNHSDKILQLVLWVVPVLTNLLMALTYLVAMGKQVRVEVVILMFMGLLFVVIGNYMPKCKQNYTIGIKIPWTLESEENWNKTHRFAGWLWMICGVLVMITGFVGNFWLFIGIVFSMVLAPMVYSFILHRRGI